MQKAQPTEFLDTMESILNTPIDQSMKKARSAEYFAAWKKEAEQKAHMIFASFPLNGPTIPEELRKEASDMVCRLTWQRTCKYMTDEEKIAACRVNRHAMHEYAWEMANKAAAEQWKLVLAASKQ